MKLTAAVVTAALAMSIANAAPVPAGPRPSFTDGNGELEGSTAAKVPKVSSIEKRTNLTGVGEGVSGVLDLPYAHVTFNLGPEDSAEDLVKYFQQTYELKQKIDAIGKGVKTPEEAKLKQELKQQLWANRHTLKEHRNGADASYLFAQTPEQQQIRANAEAEQQRNQERILALAHGAAH